MSVAAAAPGPYGLPPQHPMRIALNDEVHARPPEALEPPLSLSQIALLHPEDMPPAAPWEAMRDLALRFGRPPPAPDANHVSANFGPFRLRWERHTEFSRCMVITPGTAEAPFAEPAIAALPADWVAALPGQLVVATHAALLAAPQDEPDAGAIAARHFAGNQIIGASVLGARGFAFTDMRIAADGFGQLLVLDRGMTPWQAGRIVQRLLEIDTYRIMALLALPVARELVPILAADERELAGIIAALLGPGEADEPVLLSRLTRLAAGTESREARHRYRFDAAAAYHELVQRRIEELREGRIEGLQTFREFTERRLAPAMNTCRTVGRRQDQLAARIARATGLLSTRVDLVRRRQNQSLLESMNRRAQMQLRLQQTVEGLSVAAITYYVVGLIAYIARGAGAAGLGLREELVVAAAAPIVAVIAFIAIRRLRREATDEGGAA